MAWLWEAPSFTAEEATVIVGTAFDSSMGEKLRVTMVATGLGNPLSKQGSKPQVVVNNEQATGTYGPMGRNGFDPEVNYDIPSTIRNNPRRTMASLDVSDQGIDTLDIPAFLRKQAD